MPMIGLKRISAALGIIAAMAATASAEGEAPSMNQQTANTVASTLRSSRALAGQRIEIQASEGIVTLTGSLATSAQKAEALARTQHVAGVRGVVDDLKVVGDRANLAMGHHGFGHGGEVIYDGSSAPAATGTTTSSGPMPEGPAGMTGATQASAPGAPNYAWPSYAPYPNFSAVGYPTAYPWQAFPNIGPFYPYPEVPLDWRAVTLRWDDGIWWLDFKKHYTRPFFTPYPFGLFAY